MRNTHNNLPEMQETEGRESTLPRLLSTVEAARYFSVSASTIRKLFYEGQIEAVRFGTKLRYDVRDLDAYVSRHKETAI